MTGSLKARGGASAVPELRPPRVQAQHVAALPRAPVCDPEVHAYPNKLAPLGKWNYSGGHRVDTSRLSGVLSGATITKANAADVRSATGFAIGGVAPVGHPESLRTIVSVALSRFDELWAAAGHPHYVFPTTYDELLRITGGEAAEVGELSEPGE